MKALQSSAVISNTRQYKGTETVQRKRWPRQMGHFDSATEYLWKCGFEKLRLRRRNQNGKLLGFLVNLSVSTADDIV